MTLQALPYVLLQGFLFGSTLIASRFSVGQFRPTTYIGMRMVLATLCHLAVYMLARRQKWPNSSHLWRHAALLGVVGTAVPMVAIVSSLQYLPFYNIKRFGATAASMPLYVIPVVASLGGALVLDEQITTGMLAGTGLIAAGIALINRPQRR